MEKILNFKGRATLIDIEGNTYTGIEIPPELFDHITFANGEVLDFDVDENKIVITKTNIITSE